MSELPSDPALVELSLAQDGNQSAWLCRLLKRRRDHQRSDDGKIVTLQALGHKAPQEVQAYAGCAASLIYRSQGTLWRQSCVLMDTSCFPTLRATLEGEPLPLRRDALAEVDTTFPVRFQLIGDTEARDLGRRFKERLQMQVGWGARARTEQGSVTSVLEDQSELAILGLAKSMVRLDARFDHLLEKLDKPKKKLVAGAGDEKGSNPHEILIFSLAKMMVTLLDEKFERLLAALRDPDVLARWSKKNTEETGEEGPAVTHDVMVIQSLARFQDNMGEKFERIARLLAGRGQRGIALEHAWATTISGDNVVLAMARPLEVGRIIDLELRLPVFPPLPLLAFGRVASCEEQTDEEPERRFQVNAELVGLDGEDRELLIQFVFRKQREMLRARRELQQ